MVAVSLKNETHTFAVKAPTRNPLAGHRQAAADHYVATHLYDNVGDPHQQRNLIEDPASADLRRQLAERLAERIHEVEGSRPTIS